MANIDTPAGRAPLTTKHAASKTRSDADALPSGPGAAALLAAAIGCAAMGVFALLGDAFAGISKFFVFYTPTGALSGVSTSAIIVWLAAWYGLNLRWRDVDVDLRKLSIVAFVLLGIGFAFTFPPIMDLVQGK